MRLLTDRLLELINGGRAPWFLLFSSRGSRQIETGFRGHAHMSSWQPRFHSGSGSVSRGPVEKTRSESQQSIWNYLQWIWKPARSYCAALLLALIETNMKTLLSVSHWAGEWLDSVEQETRHLAECSHCLYIYSIYV